MSDAKLKTLSEVLIALGKGKTIMDRDKVFFHINGESLVQTSHYSEGLFLSELTNIKMPCEVIEYEY